ncbi:MAG: hypothetical protein LC118_00250, partial [Dehalococcoidia bacterium]|nr:hypothetical protein [Dehalococcoidia bacterium]
LPPIEIAPNWTSAAGAVEAILAYLGTPLPRHAVMGLTGHAWHLCLGSREDVVALPSGPSDYDRAAMAGRYARTGWRWERFSGTPADRDVAIEWAKARLNRGVPLIGWDFHLHEFAVVYGVDVSRGGFLVSDVITAQVSAFAPWDTWPSLGEIELVAPIEPVDEETLATIVDALQTALDCFAGNDGPADGQPRGTAGLEAWAAAFESETEVDRAGNAYTLAVLQAARLDGAAFLADVSAALPELSESLGRAERALTDEAAALSPLLTLFPFPTGGHGNVANGGLRRAAAMALRRSARHERVAAEAIREALEILEQEV